MNKRQDDKAWKVLKSEYIFQEPWLTVRREHIKLPNGNEIPDYYLLDYPNWVNIIAITKEKEFVLIRQYRHGLGYSAMELCAGVVENYDPSPLVSAQRELLEESGYGNGNWVKYAELSVNPGTHTNTTYCFLATDVEKVSEQNLETTEDISVHLLTLEELKETLFKDGIKQAVQAAPLWKYLAESKLL
ncbi:NUDIX hydrolase [Dysgonomonas sp. Marseille-P4677]|uniref:NUDIX hydrolase n=1 Tax=Dysgonomonas sp. Marseille-P4677 TaxID=2364790 RepID=UPI001913BD74|nr:NUDIX hydrolase [Dysgonomonas sp. Marseille-P4677]MBK5719414.1 NUDIX hydrolase [Dysgonomonas sp. Marseille-P4677]